MGVNSLSGNDEAALSAGKLNAWRVELLQILQHNTTLLALLTIIMIISFVRLWNSQPKFYAHAYQDQSNPAQLQNLFSASAAEIISGRNSIDGKITIGSSKDSEVANLEQQLRDMVGDSPIREMIPYIAKRDKDVAAMLVGIAKKESSWGSASPSKDGKTCYNYWGYKGAGSLGTGMGYGCFSSPEEAVDVVGNRIQVLVKEKKLDTPAKMIVWKCGSAACTGHDPQGVRKWISDVNQYYTKIMRTES